MRLNISALPALLFIAVCFFTQYDLSEAQRDGYWQQEVNYEMEIDFDVNNHRFDGTQKLTYSNHSPDTLHRVYYHLYFNAFQPNSMMDKRSRTIEDPDSRVQDRIYHLEEDEIGYQHVQKLTQNGTPVEYEIKETVMEVSLAEPILPDSETVFEMEFEAQVPLQVRRSGRNNAEGIEYSMAQWYPKMAEYDYMGWHATPYVGREFHGVFGNFDVTIHIDRDYVVAAAGYLQNPQ
ncbi:MAG: M1 family peptidase, partial [Balneolaceae bacterium]